MVKEKRLVTIDDLDYNRVSKAPRNQPNNGTENDHKFSIGVAAKISIPFISPKSEESLSQMACVD